MGARLTSPRFVGRTTALGRLDTALDRASSGRPATVLLAGEAGAGKSRLIAEFLARAGDRGARALTGRCIELGHVGVPLAPAAEALRELVHTTEPGELDGLMEGAARELRRLVPELAGPSAPAPGGEEEDPPSQAGGARLFEAVRTVLERVGATRPTVVVLEDLHWADRSTRDLVSYLVHALRRTQVLLVLSYRTDEVHRRHLLQPLLAELERDPEVDSIDLPRFTRAEVASQLTGILGHPPDAGLLGRVYDRSGGNPFFVEELLAAGEEATGGPGLPRTLTDLLLHRMESLPAATQTVLRFGAAAGRRVRHDLLRVAAGLDDEALEAGLRTALHHHVLVAEAAPTSPTQVYAFRHALMQEALYQDLLPGERQRLHTAYARALSADPSLTSGLRATAAAELAYHWTAAHNLEGALLARVEAGLAAEQLFAFAEARRHFEHAVELWDKAPDAAASLAIDRADLLARAAEAAAACGDPARAVGLVGEALEAVDSSEDRVRAALLHERQGRYLWSGGETERAFFALREAVRLLRDSAPSVEQARVLAAEAQALMLSGVYRQSKERCEDAIAIARSVGARAEEGHALNTLGVDLAYLGQFDEGVRHLREALAIADELLQAGDLARAYTNLAVVLFWAGRPEESVEVALHGHQVAEDLGLGRSYGCFLLATAAYALLRLGRWPEADEVTELALAARPQGVDAIHAHLRRAELELWRGNLDPARTHLETAQRLCTRVSELQFVAPLYRGLAELALLGGRPGDARRLLIEGLGRIADLDDEWACALAVFGLRVEANEASDAHERRDRSAVEAALARGDSLHETTRRRLERHRTTGPPLAPETLGDVMEAEAEMTRLAAASDPVAWAESARAWDEARQPYRAAYARFREAEALLLARMSRARAERILRDAWGTVIRLGAEPLRASIAELALRARIRPLDRTDPQPADGPAARLGLTPRELEVLALVAGGRTNKQIAGALFISEKTAGVHVSNILRKLSVARRAEAVAVAHRLGLATTPD